MRAQTFLFLYAAALAGVYGLLQLGNLLSNTHPLFLWYTPAHYAGGICVGLFVYWLCLVTGKRATLIYVLSAIAVIGVAWELWEYALGLTSYPTDTFDTITDLIADTLGALSVFWYYRNRI